MPLAALPRELQTCLHTARELLNPPFPQEQEGYIPSTLVALDRLLMGGFDRGELLELYGHCSSGRFSLTLTLLGAATTSGESAVLVDLGDHFDPQGARAFGIDLDRLLWLRPPHLKEALVATEAVISTAFPLVILDLGTPPVPGGRGAQSSWLRLAKAARAHHTALLVSSPYRVSGTAAATALEVERTRADWQGRGASTPLLASLRTRVALSKARGRASGAADELTLRFAPGGNPGKGSTSVDSRAPILNGRFPGSDSFRRSGSFQTTGRQRSGRRRSASHPPTPFPLQESATPAVEKRAVDRNGP